MNKKIENFIIIMILLNSITAFSAQEDKLFNQARYDKIVNLYKENSLIKKNILKDDSAIVQAHKEYLSKRLFKKAAFIVWLQSSLMGAFGGLAWYAGFTAFEGLLGTGSIKQYEKNTSPAAANIMLASVALGSFMSARIAQYFYKTQDIRFYFLDNLQEEVKRDEDILIILNNLIKDERVFHKDF